jgi:small subunit ribosomal protein S12e
MSTEETNQPVEDTPMEAAPVEEDKKMDPMDALKEVLKTSLHHDGLSRGLREVVKSLDRRDAHLCVLSKSCDEPGYVKLVQAMCKQNQIPLLSCEDSKTLGIWVGLCSFDEDGEPEKVVNCSSCVVRKWGQETPARAVLLNYIKSQQ